MSKPPGFVHEPEPSCYGGITTGDLHCRSHNTDESVPNPYYIVCMKGCNHVYRSADELLDTYNGIMRQLTDELRTIGWPALAPYEDVIDPDAIRYCPLCQEEF